MFEGQVARDLVGNWEFESFDENKNKDVHGLFNQIITIVEVMH